MKFLQLGALLRPDLQSAVDEGACPSEPGGAHPGGHRRFGPGGQPAAGQRVEIRGGVVENAIRRGELLEVKIASRVVDDLFATFRNGAG
jgi:hypothetical protein